MSPPRSLLRSHNGLLLPQPISHGFPVSRSLADHEGQGRKVVLSDRVAALVVNASPKPPGGS